MGWNWVMHLARHCRLTVITEQGFEEPIQEALRGVELRLQPEFRYIPIGVRARERFWRQGDWRFYRDYRDWQLRALAVCEELTRSTRFALVHQLNMIGYREPGYLWKLGLPFIWGPVGGHAQMPWRFMSILGFRNALYYSARNIANAVQMRYSRRVRCAAAAAHTVISATAADQRAIERIHGIRSILINETGTTAGSNAVARTYSGARPLRLVWCGQILGRKALPLALRALALVEAPTHLDIVGTGPDEGRSRALAEALGVEARVSWYGHTPHSRALEIMSAADCLVFTSLQEGTPHVVHEALGLGLPVLCHDACGHGASVDETCGIKVPVRSPATSIAGLANAISALVRNPQRVEHLARGALERAQQLAWQKKAQEMLALYYGAVGRQPTVPTVVEDAS